MIWFLKKKKNSNNIVAIMEDKKIKKEIFNLWNHMSL
jgi:hypothetical protein